MSKYNKGVEWFAGLFEGEGNIYRNDEKRVLVMSIKMTDEDVIKNAYKFVKKGRLTNRRPDNNPAHKHMYEWVLCPRNDIMDLCEKILPYMGKRRTKQIKKVLKGLQRLPPKRKLKIVENCGLLNAQQITNKGALRHLNKAEKPCPDCASANRNYMRAWRKKSLEANK